MRNNINLEKVKSKTQLERQGFCKIELNNPDNWGYDSGKYVLVSIGAYRFSKGGSDNISVTPVATIKEALAIYNSGLYKEFESNF
tara:strand:+ start:929 stop:1183 length:255 start_codon:yes stop_codon:yes gene_type:complete